MGLMKRLKFIVPTLQVLLLLSASLWPHILRKYYVDRTEVIAGYAYAPIYILLKINLPLTILWFPIFSALTWASSNFYPRLTSGAADAVVRAVLDLGVVSTVAFFWYFFVVEIEKRRDGASLIRFKSRTLEILKATVLIAVAVGAFAYACWDSHRLLLLTQQNGDTLYWSRMVYAVVSGLFLVIWALLLVKVAIEDLVILARRQSA
jgi:hypothetical protein